MSDAPKKPVFTTHQSQRYWCAYLPQATPEEARESRAQLRLLRTPQGRRAARRMVRRSLWTATMARGIRYLTEPRSVDYERFILSLHGATVCRGLTLHGRKGNRFVHVNAVDAPITEADLRLMAREYIRHQRVSHTPGFTVGGVDILGWEYDDLPPLRRLARALRLPVRFYQIPREVMDKQAVRQGDIRFYQVPHIHARVEALPGNRALLRFIGYDQPPENYPPGLLPLITHWSQWIDFWAVDWDYQAERGFRVTDPMIRLKKRAKTPPHGKRPVSENGWRDTTCAPLGEVGAVIGVLVVDIVGNQWVQKFPVVRTGAKPK